METIPQSFEVRERAMPVSVQSDTACLTIPQAYLAWNGAAPIPEEKAHFCDGNHGVNATIALNSKGKWKVEIAMTTNLLISRSRSTSDEPKTSRTEEDQDLAHRWHEESKRRYEELGQQWLELAEQRRRCV